MPDTFRLKITYRKVDDLKPYAGNARTHTDKQITQIATSIEQFGFTNPVLIDDADGVVAGQTKSRKRSLPDGFGGLTQTAPSLALTMFSAQAFAQRCNSALKKSSKYDTRFPRKCIAGFGSQCLGEYF